MIFLGIYLLIAAALAGLMLYDADSERNKGEAILLGLCWPITIPVMIFLAVTIFGIDD